MIERALFEYLINALWQLPLLLLGAWLLIRIARPVLLVQHLLWLTTLTLAVLLPAHGVRLRHDFPQVQTAIEASVPDASATLTLKNPGNPWAEGEVLSEPVPAVTRAPKLSVRALTMHISRIPIGPRIVDWTVSVYLLVLALSVRRLLGSSIAARRIFRKSKPHPPSQLESDLLIRCARRVHLAEARLPEIRSLAGPAASPMVIGLHRPALLLPESLRHSAAPGFDEQHLMATLAHELAHVRRRDYLVNLIARIASLPVAWHPAAVAMHGRIRQTREMICDAEAAAVFDTSAVYARSLLSLAEILIQPQGNVEAVGLFDRNRNTLEERIMTLTEPQCRITPARRAARIAAGTSLLLAAATTAATFHIKPTSPAVYAAQADAPQVVTPQTATPQTSPDTGQALPPSDAVTVQAPAPAPVPAPAPAAAPKPLHKTYSDVPSREMTPEEQEKFDKQMDEMHAQIRAAMSEIDTAKLQKTIAEAQLKAINSNELKKQLGVLKLNLQQLNSPEFGDRFARLNGPEFQKQMDDLKLKLNSPEFREQMKLKGPLVVIPNLDHLKLQTQMSPRSDDPAFKKRIADAKEQLHAQMKQAAGDPAKIQTAADKFVQEIDAATQAHIEERTRARIPIPLALPSQPPSVPPPPSTRD